MILLNPSSGSVGHYYVFDVFLPLLTVITLVLGRLFLYIRHRKGFHFLQMKPIYIVVPHYKLKVDFQGLNDTNSMKTRRYFVCSVTE